ncbi:hypothetical protein [Spiroplasma endosymbiont of Crioceris asparagi]|uniref:hypothetical protein n=1 Tax=Spiroplasma endosymbiont of Crioceris asparagi TaxID=3066286 RepID=UPI0030D4516F
MRDNKKVIYNAGSMFTSAQWDARKREGEKLKKVFPNFWIGNPVDFDTNQTERPTNQAIFKMDYDGLNDADYVILEIDSWDSGTEMEFGLVFQQALTNKNKVLIPVISDFRFKQGILNGEIPGFQLNAMITGAFEYDQVNDPKNPQMFLCGTHDDAIEVIKLLEANKPEEAFKFDIKDTYKNESLYIGFEEKNEK